MSPARRSLFSPIVVPPLVLALLLASSLTAGAQSTSTPEACPALEWNTLFVHTDGWTGADGAASVPLPNARVLWLFGDTWIGPVRDNRHAEGSTLVNNTIAIQSAAAEPHAAPPAPRFLWNSSGPSPAAWAIPEQQGEWFWPAGGALVVSPPDAPERLLVCMARLSRRDASDSIWNFALRGSTLLTINNPGDDATTWHIAQSTLTTIDPEAARIHSWGAALLTDPEDPARVLVFGIDETDTLDKGLILASAPVLTIDRFNTWRFRTADGWADTADLAASIVSNVSSEVTVHAIAGRDSRPCYLMVYSEPLLGPGILARAASSPSGPWSDPVRLYVCPEPAADKRNLVYSAKAHPRLSTDAELLVSYCVNNTDFWYMASHADLYLPRFVRVPKSALPAPPGGEITTPRPQ